MYTTPRQVNELTGYLVDELAIRRAQGIIEVASGRPESTVTNDDDRYWLTFACAWQCAYMAKSDVYQQANVDKVTQDDSSVTIGDKLYALSPLAAEALKRLSWNQGKSRSISTKPYDFKPSVRRLPDWYTW